jgi:hypothetical protein
MHANLDSLVIRTQEITLSINESELEKDVETVKIIVVSNGSYRPRSLILPRDFFTEDYGYLP